MATKKAAAAKSKAATIRERAMATQSDTMMGNQRKTVNRSKRQYSATMPFELYDRLDAAHWQEQKTVSQILEEAVEEWLEVHNY